MEMERYNDFNWGTDMGPIFAAYSSWKEGTYNEPAFCQLKFEARGPFALACGAELLADHIRHFRFSPAVMAQLFQVTDAAGRSAFDESFLNFLQRMRLRVQVNAPHEGMLLLPGEPLMLAQGPLLQLQLLSSAFHFLVWQSTHWATEAALRRWQTGQWEEENTPAPPPCPFVPQGWKMRSAYIGGSNDWETEDPEPLRQAASETVDIRPPAPSDVVQIRRLFIDHRPLGDVWLNAAQETSASVSQSTTAFVDDFSSDLRSVHFSRFHNLYQPVLIKGHPVLASPSPDYLRQRTLKQLAAFHEVGLEGYPHGWWAGE